MHIDNMNEVDVRAALRGQWQFDNDANTKFSISGNDIIISGKKHSEINIKKSNFVRDIRKGVYWQISLRQFDIHIGLIDYIENNMVHIKKLEAEDSTYSDSLNCPVLIFKRVSYIP